MIKKLLLLLVSIITAVPAFALTPQQVIQKSASRLKGAPGIVCSFSVSGALGNMKGTLKASGNRFALTAPAATTWYDGKTMWTANHSTKETTVTIPTASEVAESNPLSYISGSGNQYRMAFSARKEAGRYLVLLNPVRKGTGIKAVEVAVNAKTMLPERVMIRMSDNKVTTIRVVSLNLSKKVSAGDLKYPAASMKGYEIVDLR